MKLIKIKKPARVDPEPEPEPQVLYVQRSLDDDFEVILEEIDKVLEENAELYVQQYVQKTGE